jgi:hypothetical protein
VRLGEFAQARAVLQRAMELATGVDEPFAEARALLGLTELALASGDPGEAVAFGQRAGDAFRRLETPLCEIEALTLLSAAYAAVDDDAAAAAASAEAAALRARVLKGQQCS